MDETSQITIYHNGECSKCRGALEIMQERNVPHNVRWYLTDPLSADELKVLLAKLKMQPSQLVRKSEPVYMERYSGKNITEDEWLHILACHPELIERPIVEQNGLAIVARPPQRIFELIGNDANE